MTDQPEIETLSPWPCKCYKQLLWIAIRRLFALGDDKGAEWIIAHLPPQEKEGGPR